MPDRLEHARGRQIGLLRNLGTIDAVARVVLGVGLLLFAFLSTSTPAASFVMILGSIILVGTGVTRSCPAYEAIRTLLRRQR